MYLSPRSRITISSTKSAMMRFCSSRLSFFMFCAFWRNAAISSRAGSGRSAAAASVLLSRASSSCQNCGQKPTYWKEGGAAAHCRARLRVVFGKEKLKDLPCWKFLLALFGAVSGLSITCGVDADYVQVFAGAVLERGSMIYRGRSGKAIQRNKQVGKCIVLLCFRYMRRHFFILARIHPFDESTL